MAKLKLVKAEPPRSIIPICGWQVKGYSRSPERKWPARVVIWDTEGEEQEDGSYRFICAHMRLWLRDADYAYHPEEEVLVHSPDAFWDHLDGWTRNKGPMRTFCHNLGFDLGMVDWYANVARLGYHIDFDKGDLIWPESEGSLQYLTIRRGQRSPVTLCDSATIFHCQNHQLGVDLDMPPQPPLEQPEERCRWDTQALATALLERYYPWLLEHDTSPLPRTGTGHGWAYFMANHYQDDTVYHHTYEELLEYEKGSRYAGRREGWRHGEVEERVEDWDYQYAHARICLEPLPVRVLNPGYETEDTTTLTDYLVETDVPCLPFQKDSGEIIYPIGRFPARLWGPEAAMALDAGARLASYPGAESYTYERQPFMESWANDLIDMMEDNPDKIVRHALKSWSHTVPSKWGQLNGTYKRLDDDAVGAFWPPEMQDEAIKVAYQHHHPDGYQRILHSHFGAFGVRDQAKLAHHTNVATQSYVVMQTRIRLWRAMQAAGLDEIVHVNTDGLLVTKRGGDRLRRATRKGQLPGLRLKTLYRYGVAVENAQAVIDRDPSQPVHKLAGIPRAAIRAGARVWVANTIHQRLLEPPLRVATRFTLPPGALGRQRAPDGRTRPYKVSR